MTVPHTPLNRRIEYAWTPSKLKRSAIWLIITVILTIGTFGLSSLSSVPGHITKWWRHSDWVWHALEYGVLAWCLLMYFHEKKLIIQQRSVAYLCAILFVGIIGGLNELWQGYVPHRSPSWSDEVANLLGALLFIGLFHLIKARGMRRADRCH